MATLYKYHITLRYKLYEMYGREHRGKWIVQYFQQK